MQTRSREILGICWIRRSREDSKRFKNLVILKILIFDCHVIRKKTDKRLHVRTDQSGPRSCIHKIFQSYHSMITTVTIINSISTSINHDFYNWQQGLTTTQKLSVPVFPFCSVHTFYSCNLLYSHHYLAQYTLDGRNILSIIQ